MTATLHLSRTVSRTRSPASITCSAAMKPKPVFGLPPQPATTRGTLKHGLVTETWSPTVWSPSPRKPFRYRCRLYCAAPHAAKSTFCRVCCGSRRRRSHLDSWPILACDVLMPHTNVDVITSTTGKSKSLPMLPMDFWFGADITMVSTLDTHRGLCQDRGGVAGTALGGQGAL